MHQKKIAFVYLLSILVTLLTISGCGGDKTIINQAPGVPPVANAGHPQSLPVGSVVQLDGTKSTDANGDLLTFSWKMEVWPVGSGATLDYSTEPKASFLADVEGIYILSLTVNDGTYDSEPSYVIIIAADENLTPVANAGADQNVLTGDTVYLDGSDSHDGDDDPLSYSWHLDTKPIGSEAVIDNPMSAFPSLLVDLEGTYELSLVVHDGQTYSPIDTVTINAAFANTAPVANAGGDQNVHTGSLVSLDGSDSSDANGDVLTYLWAFTSKPQGSQATLSDTTSAEPTFTADKDGLYALSLMVNDGTVDSLLPDTVTIESHRDIDELAFNVVDAEYSDSLEVIVIASSLPLNQLHIYDPTTGSDTPVTLVLPPESVSVSPDGLYAAVGHDGWISYVDLAGATVEKQLAVSTDVFDIVLAGNGYIYAFPRVDQWEHIRCIEIATGTETLSTGYSIYAGTRAKLHPSGTSIYGADNGLSPSDIEKYDISTGTAELVYDSPYHGDYSMCGNLWISEDGFRIFTACGNVFRSSEIRTDDMIYNGSLSSLSRVTSLDHSLIKNKVVAVPGNIYNTMNNDTEVQIYGYDYLSFEQKIQFPKFLVNDSAFTSHGKFVFFDSSGNKVHALVKADNNSGLLYEYGVVTYDF